MKYQSWINGVFAVTTTYLFWRTQKMNTTLKSLLSGEDVQSDLLSALGTQIAKFVADDKDLKLQIAATDPADAAALTQLLAKQSANNTALNNLIASIPTTADGSAAGGTGNQISGSLNPTTSGQATATQNTAQPGNTTTGVVSTEQTGFISPVDQLANKTTGEQVSGNVASEVDTTQSTGTVNTIEDLKSKLDNMKSNTATTEQTGAGAAPGAAPNAG